MTTRIRERNSKLAPGVILVVLLVGTMFVAIKWGPSRPHRSKHHAKLVKTKDRHIFVQNEGGVWWEYVRKQTNDMSDIDIELPLPESSDFRLPPGSWRQAGTGPKAEEIAQEEESVVEETDSGEPSADAQGDIGADSDGNAAGDAAGDSGGGDSGGDGGGDGGGD